VKKVQTFETLFLREWKDVGLTQAWVREMQSGGTNLPAAELGMTRWFKSKSSDTREEAVKRLKLRFELQGKVLRFQQARFSRPLRSPKDG